MNQPKPILCFALIALFASPATPMAAAQPVISLPPPGRMVSLSPTYEPPVLKGLKINPDPWLLNFIVDMGQDAMTQGALKTEGNRLARYFLAALAIPESDLWVNLSPYEKDRIVPELLGQTALGRDLLAQDYLLKQISASLIYPEKEMGKAFWRRIYERSAARTAVIVPLNIFNKVWIVADKADVAETATAVVVVKSHLKVMLETDHQAARKNIASPTLLTQGSASAASQAVRDLVLPEIEIEVNQGRHFAPLRQILNAVILSAWFKKRLKQTVLNRVYSDQRKVAGITLADPLAGEHIYQRYLAAYKKGVFNYVKEDQVQGQTLARKYFSGGVRLAPAEILRPVSIDSLAMTSPRRLADLRVAFSPVKDSAQAKVVRAWGDVAGVFLFDHRTANDIQRFVFAGNEPHGDNPWLAKDANFPATGWSAPFVYEVDGIVMANRRLRNRLFPEDLTVLKVYQEENGLIKEVSPNSQEKAFAETLHKRLFEKDRSPVRVTYNPVAQSATLDRDAQEDPVVIQKRHNSVRLGSRTDEWKSFKTHVSDQDIYFGALQLPHGSARPVIVAQGTVRIHLKNDTVIEVFRSGPKVMYRRSGTLHALDGKRTFIFAGQDLGENRAVNISQRTEDPRHVEIFNDTGDAIQITYEHPFIEYLAQKQTHRIATVLAMGKRYGLISPQEIFRLIHRFTELKRFKYFSFSDSLWTSYVETFKLNGKSTGFLKSYWSLRRDHNRYRAAVGHVFTSKGNLLLAIRKNLKLESLVAGVIDSGLNGKETVVHESASEVHLPLSESDLMPVRNSRQKNGLFRLDFEDNVRDEGISNNIFHGKAKTRREIYDVFIARLSAPREQAWRKQLQQINPQAVWTWDEYLERSKTWKMDTLKEGRISDEVLVIVEVNPRVFFQYMRQHQLKSEKRISHGLNGEIAFSSIRLALEMRGKSSAAMNSPEGGIDLRSVVAGPLAQAPRPFGFADQPSVSDEGTGIAGMTASVVSVQDIHDLHSFLTPR